MSSHGTQLDQMYQLSKVKVEMERGENVFHNLTFTYFSQNPFSGAVKCTEE